MGRRRFLQLLAAGGATAVLAACGADSSGGDATPPDGSRQSSTDLPGWFKDTGPFVAHSDGKSLEARLENMTGLITPASLFFVRNNSVSVDLNADDWRLSVEGDAVADPLELSYDAIRRLPSRTLISYLECAGNHRALFDLVQGRAAEGTQWGTGGVGNGEWIGVALRDVLELAGIRADAVSVLLVGMDTESAEEGFRRVLPVEKAMHPDTLLAYALNGRAPCPATMATLCAHSSPVGSAPPASSGSDASSSLPGSSGPATTRPPTSSSVMPTRPRAQGWDSR